MSCRVRLFLVRPGRNPTSRLLKSSGRIWSLEVLGDDGIKVQRNDGTTERWNEDIILWNNVGDPQICVSSEINDTFRNRAVFEDGCFFFQQQIIDKH